MSGLYHCTAVFSAVDDLSLSNMHGMLSLPSVDDAGVRPGLFSELNPCPGKLSFVSGSVEDAAVNVLRFGAEDSSTWKVLNWGGVDDPPFFLSQIFVYGGQRFFRVLFDGFNVPVFFANNPFLSGLKVELGYINVESSFVGVRVYEDGGELIEFHSVQDFSGVDWKWSPDPDFLRSVL